MMKHTSQTLLAGRLRASRRHSRGSAPLFARTARGLGVLVIGVALLLVLGGVGTAFAATFNPVLVCSDSTMSNWTSMSVDDIQAFLNTQPGILKSYYAVPYTPPLEPADVNATGAGLPDPAQVPPANGKASAAQIIAGAARDWHINPMVLLVTLQKEQSLLTTKAPTQAKLNMAMGCGIFNGSTYTYPGFGNQVWYAANKLYAYGETNHRRGPCGYTAHNPVGLWVPGNTYTYDGNEPYRANYVPLNLATFKLYTYTPHVGGSLCGGNLLFWNLYVNYFGDPVTNPKAMPVYRFYNIKTGTHFYTASESERYLVAFRMGATYHFEGVAMTFDSTNPANSQPLYRFYNVRTGTHFYTASEDEKANVMATMASTYHYDGPAYNVSTTPGSGLTVYRFYNVRTGTHFYTADPAERDNTIAKFGGIFHYEGPAYYLAQ
jgi:Repeat of unknown function (DUF5648)